MFSRRAFPSRHPSAACVLGSAAALMASATLYAAPANDLCQDAAAFPLQVGVAYSGTAVDANAEPNSDSGSCGATLTPDVYHQFTPPYDGVYNFSTCASSGAWDTVISFHTACPANSTNMVFCGDDGCGITAGFTSVNALLVGGETYIVRVASYDDDLLSPVPGTYSLLVTSVSPEPIGACCSGEVCAVVTKTDCNTREGEFLGYNTLCNPAAGTPTAYNGTGGNIPDNNVAGYSSPVTVADTFAVGSVQVRFNTITHNWVGDLEARLTHGTTTVVLFSRVGNTGSTTDSSNLNGTYTLGDDGTINFAAAATAPGVGNNNVVPVGTYKGADGFGFDSFISPAFNNAPANGAWTLTIADRQSGTIGSFASWDLILTPAGETACGASACPADFNDVNGVTVQDIFDFLTAWLAGSTSADFNGVNGVTVQDIFDFLTAWLAGC